MLNKKKIITIAIILLSAIKTNECRRHRESSFGYGFLGGLVGSSIANIFVNLSQPAKKQAPVIIQKEKIIIKEILPTNRHKRYRPFNSITTTVNHYPVY